MKSICTLHQRVIILSILLPFLAGTLVDLYVPSLPSISAFFHAPNSLVQFTISIYMLSYAVGQIFLGVLSDSLGRKKIMLPCILLFVVISLLAIYARNIYFLNVCRLFQGLCIAGLGVTCRAAAMDCFSGLDLTKAMTYLSTSWALGPIFGPFIGGYLQHFFNWQADFVCFSLYGVFLALYIVLLFPETHKEVQKLQLAQTVKVIKSMLTQSVFLSGAMMLSLIYAILVVFNMVGPFLIESTLRYSAVSYGHLALLLGFSYFIGNFSNRIFIQYFAPMKIAVWAVFGALLMSLLLLILACSFTINLYIIIIPVSLLFIACGLVFPNVMAFVMGMFPKNAGTVNAVYGTIMIGGVFVLTSFATMLKTTTQIPLAIAYISMLSAAMFLAVKKLKMAR